RRRLLCPCRFLCSSPPTLLAPVPVLVAAAFSSARANCCSRCRLLFCAQRLLGRVSLLTSLFAAAPSLIRFASVAPCRASICSLTSCLPLAAASLSSLTPRSGFDQEGKLRAICGGGRYDHLFSTFGADYIPACGFGFGNAVVVEDAGSKQIFLSCST
ncbi:hypothetical protein PIB30_069069, partial [Stylosanthes scabra]|nr:hypothetical protein [Stylosanthes scabra]